MRSLVIADLVKCNTCGEISVVTEERCPCCGVCGDFESLHNDIEIRDEYIDVRLTPEQEEFLVNVYLMD